LTASGFVSYTFFMGMEKTMEPCLRAAKGEKPGSCQVFHREGWSPACQITLRIRNGNLQRRISGIHLSRPENYLSIYQSGCNFSCRKCHSWYFSKIAEGEWYSADEILQACQQYEKQVTLFEPRERATAYHAHDTCRSCGSCVLYGKRSPFCPNVLDPSAILYSPQGFGPARNIVAFTGGDLTCRVEFYAECAERIKGKTRLFLLIETNGYALGPQNLDLLKKAGVDAFWLDIKAYKPEVHRWLTGCGNEGILRAPEEMVRRGFTVEVLSLYIPGVVEADQLVAIAQILVRVDEKIPFTILAFFPEYQMKEYRSPKLEEMVSAYEEVKAQGLKNVRLGNTGIFARQEKDFEILLKRVGRGSF
jgi:pyruvate formate lyase activating enzyme